MRETTKRLIKKYALMKLKYDFMGYDFDELSDLSFHHLIIPRSVCPQLGLEKGYIECNGVILKKNSAHEYLHIVGQFDLDRFHAITSEMIDEKIKGYLDPQNLNEIDDILTGFEREYSGVCFPGSGKEIIKPQYTIRPKSYKRY